jgi:hypothetical protein
MPSGGVHPITRLSRSPIVPARSLLGQEDQFVPPKLSARSAIRKQTVAATRGNGRDAPIPAVRGTAIEPRGSTLSGRSEKRPTHPGLGITAYLETADTREYA